MKSKHCIHTILRRHHGMEQRFVSSKDHLSPLQCYISFWKLSKEQTLANSSKLPKQVFPKTNWLKFTSTLLPFLKTVVILNLSVIASLFLNVQALILPSFGLILHIGLRIVENLQKYGFKLNNIYLLGKSLTPWYNLLTKKEQQDTILEIVQAMMQKKWKKLWLKKGLWIRIID